MLEDQAKNLISYDPNYGHAYSYLASARLAMLAMTSSATLDRKRVDAVDADIKRAIAKDPGSAIPVVLQADLLHLQAQHLAPANSDEGHKLLQSATAVLQAFLKNHANGADTVRTDEDAASMATIELANLLARIWPRISPTRTWRRTRRSQWNG